MTLSPCFKKKFGESTRCLQPRGSRSDGAVFLVLLISLSLGGCSHTTKEANANSTGSGVNPNGNANANDGGHTVSSQPVSIDFKEPERYSVAMTISTQAASEAPASMATQQFGFARIGADRRWAFLLPAPLGHIVYLEKSGLKYLVFLDRNQYVEIAADVLGYQPASVLTPGAIAEQLKPRAQYEQLGLEPVNGRTAMKYRMTGAGEAAGKTSGVIFVDQEIGLPLRCELNSMAQPGTSFRVIAEARDVQLNPDRSQFDVPAGMRKVAPQEVKQQIEAFAGALRYCADLIAGKHTAPAGNAVQSANNKNANRRTR